VSVTFQLLYHLASKPAAKEKDWPETRLQNAQMWLKTWNRLENEKDEQFNPANLPSINVSPPAKTGLPPGVSPDAIQDPQLKQEYLQALEKNRIIIEQYNHQYGLLQLEAPFKRVATGYLINSYSQPPANLEEIQKLLEIYLKDRKETAEMLQAVRKK